MDVYIICCMYSVFKFGYLKMKITEVVRLITLGICVMEEVSYLMQGPVKLSYIHWYSPNAARCGVVRCGVVCGAVSCVVPCRV